MRDSPTLDALAEFSGNITEAASTWERARLAKEIEESESAYLRMNLDLRLLLRNKPLRICDWPRDDEVWASTILREHPEYSLRLAFLPSKDRLAELAALWRRNQYQDITGKRLGDAIPSEADYLLHNIENPEHWPLTRILEATRTYDQGISVDSDGDEESAQLKEWAPIRMCSSVYDSDNEALRWLLAKVKGDPTSGSWILYSMNSSPSDEFPTIFRIDLTIQSFHRVDDEGERSWQIHFAPANIELAPPGTKPPYWVTGRFGRIGDGKGVYTAYTLSVECVNNPRKHRRPSKTPNHDPDMAATSVGNNDDLDSADVHSDNDNADDDETSRDNVLKLSIHGNTMPDGSFTAWLPAQESAPALAVLSAWPQPWRFAQYDYGDSNTESRLVSAPTIKGNLVDFGDLVFPYSTIEVSVNTTASAWPLGYPGVDEHLEAAIYLVNADNEEHDCILEFDAPARILSRVMGIHSEFDRIRAVAYLAADDRFRLSSEVHSSVGRTGFKSITLELKPEWNHVRKVLVSHNGVDVPDASIYVVTVDRDELPRDYQPGTEPNHEWALDYSQNFSVRMVDESQRRMDELPQYLPTLGGHGNVVGHWVYATAPGYRVGVVWAPAKHTEDVVVELPGKITQIVMQLRTPTPPAQGWFPPLPETSKVTTDSGQTPSNDPGTVSFDVLIDLNPDPDTEGRYTHITGQSASCGTVWTKTLEAEIPHGAKLKFRLTSFWGFTFRGAWLENLEVSTHATPMIGGIIHLPMLELPPPHMVFRNDARDCFANPHESDAWPKLSDSWTVVVGSNKVKAFGTATSADGSTPDRWSKPKFIADGVGTVSVPPFRNELETIVALPARVKLTITFEGQQDRKFQASLLNLHHRSGSMLTLDKSTTLDLWCPQGEAQLIIESNDTQEDRKFLLNETLVIGPGIRNITVKVPERLD